MLPNKPLGNIVQHFRYSEEADSRLLSLDYQPIPYIDNNGYWVVKINRSIYKVHRIIFKLFYPDFDENLYIDHIDGDKKNNSISNLRLVTHGVNMKNKRKYASSTTGYNGITKRKIRGIEYLRIYARTNGILTEKYLNVSKNGGYENSIKIALKIRSELQTNEFTERHGK